MAHQYSAMPPFGNGYPIPYYSPYAPSNAQTVSNTSPAYQQPNTLPSNPQTPTPQPTNMRYDVNTHVHQQTAPFSFPHTFNPEFLKHLPPPPPPPASFNLPSVTPVNFPQYSPSVVDPAQAHSQTYPVVSQGTPAHGLLQPPSSYHLAQSVSSPSAPMQSEAQNTGAFLVKQNVPQTFQSVEQVPPPSIADQEQEDSSATNFSDHPPSMSQADPAYPTSRSQLTVPATKDNENSNQRPSAVGTSPVGGAFHTQTSQTTLTSDQQQAYQGNRSLSLRERAKAAILSLAPHKITYRDLVAEGVNSSILEQLYSELGLNGQSTLQNQQQQQQQQQQQEQTSTKKPESLEPSRSIPTPSHPTAVSSISVPVGPTSTGNLAMERKDRIAQLLAAKAGRSNQVVGSPPFASPTSAAETTTARQNLQDANSVIHEISKAQPSQHIGEKQLAPQSEGVRSGLEQFQKELHQTAQTAFAASGLNTPATQMQSARDTVAPVERRTFMQAGFSSMIPGLFMAVDEETSGSDFPDSSQLQSAELERSSREQQSNSNVLSEVASNHKRPIASVSIDTSDDRAAKRAAFSREASVDVEMDIDGSESGEASEGEVVEDEAMFGRSSIHQASSGLSQSAQPLRTDAKPTGANYRSNMTRSQLSTEVSPHVSVRSAALDTGLIRGKMVESEQRRSFNNAQSLVSSPLSSGPTTPAALQQTQPPLGSILSRSQDFDLGSKDVVPSPRPLSKLTPAQLAERAAQLKADLIRQKAMRQKQLVEGIPSLDDEVVRTTQRIQQSRSKLTEIRVLLARCEADVARAREDERQVMEEIDRLERLLSDGTPGQKQLSEDLQALKKPHHVGSTVPPDPKPSMGSLCTVDSEESGRSAQYPNNSTSETRPMSNDAEQSAIAQVPVIEPQQLTLGTVVPVNATKMEVVSMDPEIHHSSIGEHSLSTTSSLAEPNISSNQASVNHELDTVLKPSNDEGQQDELDNESMDHSDSASEDSRMSIDDEADAANIEYDVDSDGSASMSDSGSEDYEPAEPSLNEASDSAREESDEYDPEAAVNGESPQSDSVNNYEPSESVGQVIDPSDRPSTQSSHPPSPVEATGELFRDGPTEQEDKTQASVISLANKSRVDDVETGLKLTEANALVNPESLEPQESVVEIPLGLDKSSSTHFVPYQSPLSAFKSYRFHPSFNDQVKSGYRSLTYSNKIDSRLPLCPTELSGEVCTDPQCQEQHFGSMALTDDKILVQMSSAHDIKDKAQRDQYLLGLKQVIASLRQDGVKEFSQVADALSKYRRDWSTAQQGV